MNFIRNLRGKLVNITTNRSADAIHRTFRLSKNMMLSETVLDGTPKRNTIKNGWKRMQSERREDCFHDENRRSLEEVYSEKRVSDSTWTPDNSRKIFNILFRGKCNPIEERALSSIESIIEKRVN